MKQIELIVFGTPVPQGSMRAFVIPGKGGARPRAIVTADNRRTKPWRQEIAAAADEAMQKSGFSVFAGVAVNLDCRFYFDKPKSVKKSVVSKITKPDTEKLLRTVGDALTGTVYKDDAQINVVHGEKHFDSRPRAEITVTIGA